MAMENKINCEEYYVAFLDLLGCRSIIEKDTQDENLNNIYKIYKSWLFGMNSEINTDFPKIVPGTLTSCVSC